MEKVEIGGERLQNKVNFLVKVLSVKKIVVYLQINYNTH